MSRHRHREKLSEDLNGIDVDAVKRWAGFEPGMFGWDALELKAIRPPHSPPHSVRLVGSGWSIVVLLNEKGKPRGEVKYLGSHLSMSRWYLSPVLEG